MPSFTDQTGRTVALNTFPPKRIISLVPSQTELLADLGLNNEVVGITKFCVHPPEWFRNKTRIGGTKNLNIKKIAELNPELIIANKEENEKNQIAELEKYFPVWVSDVKNRNEAYQMIEQTGILTGKQYEAEKLLEQIKNNFSQLPPPGARLRACYLIWQNPYMTAGGDTFISDMLYTAGFENIYSGKKRYPEVTIQELQSAGCQLLLLSSEPFPFKEEHVKQLQKQLPETKIRLVDGEIFSWYGSRLLYAAAYFIQLRNELAINE